MHPQPSHLYILDWLREAYLPDCRHVHTVGSVLEKFWFYKILRINSGIFVVWTVSGFLNLKFFKCFPNLNPRKSRGSKMNLEFDLMKHECHHRLCEQGQFWNWEFEFNIVALMGEFCESVSLHFASFHLVSPWGHWSETELKSWDWIPCFAWCGNLG